MKRFDNQSKKMCCSVHCHWPGLILVYGNKFLRIHALRRYFLTKMMNGGHNLKQAANESIGKKWQSLTFGRHFYTSESSSALFLCQTLVRWNALLLPRRQLNVDQGPRKNPDSFTLKMALGLLRSFSFDRTR